MDYLGRADTQIKLRGQRIELGEIENTLLACPQVTQAAAAVHHSNTGAHLVAYISGVPQPDLSVVRQRLCAQFPEYMVPGSDCGLRRVSVDLLGQDRPYSRCRRRCLPAHPSGRRGPRPKRSSPRCSPEVLGLDRVGLDDFFFALGGDSLIGHPGERAAVQLALGREGARCGIMFDASTVGDLADYLDRHRSRRRYHFCARSSSGSDSEEESTCIPLFCIHPGGGVSWPYQALGNSPDWPIIGIQQVLQGEEAEPRVNSRYGEKLCRQDPRGLSYGPYNLLGWSFGGLVAHEFAIELRRHKK